MEASNQKLTTDKDRDLRIKAAEMDTEVRLLIGNEKVMKKKPSERRNSQGPLTYILKDNYIGSMYSTNLKLIMRTSIVFDFLIVHLLKVSNK